VEAAMPVLGLAASHLATIRRENRRCQNRAYLIHSNDPETMKIRCGWSLELKELEYLKETKPVSGGFQLASLGKPA
jgi:hypothetical protein